MRVENSYAKECIVHVAVPEILGFHIYSLAPLSTFVLLRRKVSPLIGCRDGSTATLEKTCVRCCASRSLILL